jgi:hypothetical protein
MKKWEYQTIVAQIEGDAVFLVDGEPISPFKVLGQYRERQKLTRYLSQIGKEGWDVISMTPWGRPGDFRPSWPNAGFYSRETSHLVRLEKLKSSR